MNLRFYPLLGKLETGTLNVPWRPCNQKVKGMDPQFSVFLTRFWQQAQPPSAGARKLGFLSNRDFAAAAQGSDACVPVPRAQLCPRRHEQSSNVASLGCHIGVTRSDLHPASQVNTNAQLPGTRGGISLPNQAGGAFTLSPFLYRFITLESIK